MVTRRCVLLYVKPSTYAATSFLISGALVMAWIYLLSASLVEIVMALLLKASDGWTRLLPGLLGLAAGGASVFLLTHALKTLPVGTAYAIWTGIGSVGVALIGILALGE